MTQSQEVLDRQQAKADMLSAQKLRIQRKNETAIGSSMSYPVKTQTAQDERINEYTPFLAEVEVYNAVVRQRMAENPIPSDLDKTKPEKALATARLLLKKDTLHHYQESKFKICITDLKRFIGRGTVFSDETRPMTDGQKKYLKKLGAAPDTDLTMKVANEQIKALMVEQFGDPVQQSVSKLRREAEAKEERVAAAEIGKLEQRLSTWIELDEYPTYFFDPRTFRVLNQYGKPITMEIDKNSLPRWRLRTPDGKRKWLTVANAFKMAGGQLINE
jgi:hypothetical protein